MASPFAEPKYTVPSGAQRTDERNHTSLSTRPSWRVTVRRTARDDGSISDRPPLVPTHNEPDVENARLTPLLAGSPFRVVRCATVFIDLPSMAKTPSSDPTH